MNEPEDPESTDEETGGSDVGKTDAPWYLQKGEERSADQEPESEERDEAEDSQQDAAPLPVSEVAAGILRVRCPGCQKEMSVLREHLGMQGECLNCGLPIVAKMAPSETGGMQVVAGEVMTVDQAGATDEAEADVESDKQESQAEDSVPPWKKSFLDSRSEVKAADEDENSDQSDQAEGVEEDQEANEEVESDDESESKDEDVDQSDQVEGVEEDKEASDEGESDDESESKDEDAEANPSWVDGGNPWNAPGLKEKGAEETSDEEIDEQKGEDDQPEDGQVSEDLDSPDDEESDEETIQQEEKESRSSLVIAIVIILVVIGGGLTLFLNPDLIRGSSSAKDKAAVEKVVNSSASEKAGKSGQDEKKGGEKGSISTGPDVSVAQVSSDDSGKSAQADDNKMKVASEEPKAIKRPDEKDESKPEMATARAEVHDDVALRMHQEGERAIRRFYSVGSIEERSAFVLRPKLAIESMRSFYEQQDQLPTIRYLEFKGKVLDPTSGLRFGVFDVHEKENEESHRWCVVEIEPGRYLLDWGLYEQLDGSTLVSYLSKTQVSSKKFRFLMKLGDFVSAVDGPWDVESVKVYLQVPLADGGGGESILLKKSDAERLGILSELAGGKMKIGQVILDWVSSDKDPGSKVPTIIGIDGWGAWSKLKMRGLN